MARREWTAADVLGAAAEWVWVPAEARVHESEGLLVVARPDYDEQPTEAYVRLCARPAEELLAEGEEAASRFGRDELAWLVSDTTRPAELEPLLLARGGEVVERTDVLAIPLAGGLPDLGPVADVELRDALDAPTMRDGLSVEAEAFAAGHVSDEKVDHALAQSGTNPAGPSGRVVAYVGGKPVATGGWTAAGPVLRLWGAGTLEQARGRGAYRAVLARRLRIGHERGCEIALTTGRVESSSPILQRGGFTRYGEQRFVRLPLSPR